MSLYGKSDAASNVNINTVMLVNHKGATVNTANRDALYGNTTANAFTNGVTQGIFGVSASEAQALRAGANTRVVSPGYQLRTEGSGGRAGRVQMETLVAVRITGTDASDDAVVPDYKILITTQPSSGTFYSGNNQIGTFTVVGDSTPTGATLSYKWQKWNGSAFANLTNTGAYSNTATATLSVLANTASDGEIYRARLSAAGTNEVIYTSNATITIAA